jgi:hypothetical protein
MSLRELCKCTTGRNGKGPRCSRYTTADFCFQHIKMLRCKPQNPKSKEHSVEDKSDSDSNSDSWSSGPLTMEELAIRRSETYSKENMNTTPMADSEKWAAADAWSYVKRRELTELICANQKGCDGITVSGRPCKNRRSSDSIYCSIHNKKKMNKDMNKEKMTSRFQDCKSDLDCTDPTRPTCSTRDGFCIDKR